MEKYRNEDGFIDINSLIEMESTKIKYLNRVKTKFCLTINEGRYFFKPVKHREYLYRELIAEELAKDFNIPCAHYDIAVFNDFTGVISKDIFKKYDNHFYLSQLLITEKYNNLEDIWDMLLLSYRDESIVEKLMKQLVDIFMFDVLIGNTDRHSENMELLENENGVNFSPIYDNLFMLKVDAMKYGIYSLTVDRDDTESKIRHDENSNLLYRFLNVSDRSYEEIFKSKLWIISEENISKAISRVEKRIKCEIDEDIKESIKGDFAMNNMYINRVLKRVDEKKAGLI